MLTLFQEVQQNDPAIWKFQRIVMGCRVVTSVGIGLFVEKLEPGRLISSRLVFSYYARAWGQLKRLTLPNSADLSDPQRPQRRESAGERPTVSAADFPICCR